MSQSSEYIQSNKKNKRLSNKYQIITFQLRKKLIDLVVQQGYSIYRASRMLGIKNVTAKAIMKKFRQNQHIFQRKSQKQSKNIEEEQYNRREGIQGLHVEEVNQNVEQINLNSNSIIYNNQNEVFPIVFIPISNVWMGLLNNESMKNWGNINYFY